MQMCFFDKDDINAGDSWIAKIRTEHPRLFFNKETWPQIWELALHQEKDWYTALKKRVDGYPDNPTSESQREDFAYHQTAKRNMRRLSSRDHKTGFLSS